MQDKCEKDGTYANLDERMKEIKNNSLGYE